MYILVKGMLSYGEGAKICLSLESDTRKIWEKFEEVITKNLKIDESTVET